MTGNWNGYYKFDNEIIQNAIGFDKTNFTIVIENYEGADFQGKVNDDVSTGGMKETGDVVGKVSNNIIKFQKFMPKNCTIDGSGNRETLDKKHPTLYYEGTFSDDKSEASGKWYFKREIGFRYGFLPVLYSPGRGTWSMKKVS